jgi:hypothetical protein
VEARVKHAHDGELGSSVKIGTRGRRRRLVGRRTRRVRIVGEVDRTSGGAVYVWIKSLDIVN